MAAPKRNTHEVVHPKLYMAVKGELQHVPQGTPLILTDKIAEGLGKKVKKLGGKEAIDLTQGDSDKSDKTDKKDTKK